MNFNLDIENMLTIEDDFKPLTAINMNYNLNVNHIELVDQPKKCHH